MIRAAKWRVASLKTDVLNIFKALNWVLSYPHPLCLHFQIPFFTIPFNKILNVGKKKIVICMNPLVPNLIASQIIHLIILEKSKQKISGAD